MLLFIQEPDKYRESFALTQLCLGDTYYDAKEYQKAEETYLQALENYRILFEESPQAYRARLAWVQYWLMNIYAKDGFPIEQYETMLDSALANCEILYKSNSSYQSMIVNLRNRKGWRSLKKGQVDEALALFESAYELDPVKSAAYLSDGYNEKAY